MKSHVIDMPFFRFSAAALLTLYLTLAACKMTHDLPRNEKLPLFHPHRSSFICQVEATTVPPIDAQADLWFLEAITYENNPELLDEEIDYPLIIKLTRQAANRRHWKAMLNLASLYLEGRDPSHGKEDAIRLVESAMRLGVPAAYDRMGTYHMNGVVAGGATRAYAFWQRAADMGNPHAMAYLGAKLKATWDNPKELFWANIPVAMKMLECALRQGEGDAALHLSFAYAPSGDANADQKARALRVLHEGVKLGSSACAGVLTVDFNGQHDTSETVVPFRDKARSERYLVLADAIDFSPVRRFPNLDKVLPLPPAALPRWDGKRETLIQAAMAFTSTRSKQTSSPLIKGTDRTALDSAFTLKATGETTNDRNAPFASYWRPTAPHESVEVQAYLAKRAPALYETGEKFDLLPYPATANAYGTIRNVVWERMITIPSDHAAVTPRAAIGLSREVPLMKPGLSCDSNEPCPMTGIWQPWLPVNHPMQHVVNQSWRQTWITSGQPFPDPLHDWLLSLDKSELSWHLLDNSPPDLA